MVAYTGPVPSPALVDWLRTGFIQRSLLGLIERARLGLSTELDDLVPSAPINLGYGDGPVRWLELGRVPIRGVDLIQYAKFSFRRPLFAIANSCV